MGSSISVSSIPGEGSTFSFKLNLEGTRFTKLESEQGDSQVEHSISESIRVLLVEDNIVNQIVASSFLKRWGISADVANHGAEALALIAKNIYDIILMDIQMPVMDGYEAAMKIRSLPDEHLKTVPIIALTASAMAGMTNRVLDAGMTDFISKPFSPEDLYGKIIRHTNNGTSLRKAV
jgi:CheY-like chemotaxis protein